ncbi:MAG TPA: glycosyltransferase family 2 protein [Chloroflexota bacterium]|nr:glycosyltransferase family 2 protein [Chloroflexota bacterium]
MDLSIVVVSWNTRELLRNCLTSIDRTIDGIQYEVLVVDNASTDGSAEMVARDYPDTRLIRNRDNRGFARANNQAMRVAQGRHLLLLNSDAALLPGAASTLVSFMETHPGAGLVGAQLLNADGSFQASYADFPSFVGEVLLLTRLASLVYPRTYPSYPSEQSQAAAPVDWVFGACLLARRSAVDAVGFLDEDYFMYSEETDWCYRMHRGGWEVCYVPEAKVLHWSGQSAGAAPERKRSQLYRSKCLFMRKHWGRFTAHAFSLTVRIASALNLLAWTALGSADPDRARRERARQRARSYQQLLLGKL